MWLYKSQMYDYQLAFNSYIIKIYWFVHFDTKSVLISVTKLQLRKYSFHSVL
jgi:hypothetical protein